MDNGLKRASWLELFYDVAFVALVAQLTYLASSNYTDILDWLTIITIGYAIYLAWWSTTANRNFQPTETIADKLLIQLQMVGMFSLSLMMPAMFEQSYTGFFVIFGLLRGLQTFMMIRMYYLHPELRPHSYNILEGYIIGSLLWILAGLVPHLYVFIVVFMALAVDILTPLTRGKGNNTRYLNVHHLQERLGLFIMLVIGESMIVVALATSTDTLSLHNMIVVFSGLALMVGFWWLYFEYTDRYVGNRPRHLFFYLHAHGLLFMSLIFLSVGYRLVLKDTNTFDPLLPILLGSIGLAIALITIRTMLQCLYRNGVFFVSMISLFSFIIIGFSLFQRPVITLVMISLLFVTVAIIDTIRLNRNAREQQ